VGGSAKGESLRMPDEQKKKPNETPVCIKQSTYDKLQEYLIVTLPDTSYQIKIPLKTLVNSILQDWLERKEREKK
jgi:hypothetical protein